MGFDIFVQAFEHGEAAERDGDAVRPLLRSVEHAEVYGVPAPGEPLSGLMFARVSGDGWDVIVAVAQAAELTIMPVGCPVCIVSEAQRTHLPPDLAHSGVALVASGAELRAIVSGRR